MNDREFINRILNDILLNDMIGEPTDNEKSIQMIDALDRCGIDVVNLDMDLTSFVKDSEK